MGALEGLDAVMRSWDRIFASQGGLAIEPAGARVDVCGRTAVVTCVEEVAASGGKLEAVNVYRREAGRWRMTLHMASPVVLLEELEEE